MASDIDRLKTLLQRFHAKTIHITDEQLRIVYDFLYAGKFYPIKLKLPVSKSMVSTILYLKDMATSDGYDSLDKIEHYFKRQATRLKIQFRNLER
jgi:hypothetical protein